MPRSPSPPPLPVDEQPPTPTPPTHENAEAGPSRQRSVSPVAPPLPDDEQPPLPDDQKPSIPAPPRRTVAIEDGSDNDDDDHQPPLPSDSSPTWDPSAQTSLQGAKAAIEKPSHGWQAVWAPQQNAYYFWNSQTNETTWINPLEPPQPPPSEPVPAVDPDLAHLLPRESRPGGEYVSAEFNARTGRFTPATYAYKVDHLAEANRARRQEAAFFDVDEWDKEREKEWQKRKAEGDGERPKKVTKADMVSPTDERARVLDVR